MPAFMTIGKVNDSDEVEMGEIQGNATASWHVGWIPISSFSVDVKSDERDNDWESRQSTPDTRRAKKKKDEDTDDDTKGKGKKGKKKKKGKDKPQNTFKISKPTDATSCQILEWAKTPVQQDIQIDCCTFEEEWPFLTMIFTGVVPTQVDIEGELTDSLEFTWKQAKMYTYAFDEKNEPYAVDFAEFGEVAQSSATTTIADRGLSDYTPPKPEPDGGAGHVQAPPLLHTALRGGLPPVEAEDRSYDQERRRLALEPVGDFTFEVESVIGEEHLSALFVFNLEVRSTELDVPPKDIVGQPIVFRVEDEAGRQEEEARPSRFFHGICSAIFQGEMESDRRRRYHLTVVPDLWRLTQRSNSRVFQEKTVKDIVETIFKEADFSDYDMAGVTQTPPQLVYCVQYQETDFAFVSRLLEEAGIFYYFKHEEDKHTMMLCDGSTGYTTCPVDPLRFARDVYRDPRITSWRRHHAFVPGKVTLRDWNFETPNDPLEGQATTKIDLTGIADAEVFEYPGLFVDTDQATTVADRRLLERELGHQFVHAVGCYDVLTVGATFALENPPGHEEGSEAGSERWLVTSMNHRAEQRPEYGLNIISYRNVFTCIPEKTVYVPPRVTPKPRMLGPQTAVVVGDKETDEDLVDTDKYGRIKVQFHWDRLGKKDKDSSCWIRVAQTHAGAAYGSMVIPRIGTEVVVSFLEGDPDRPLVTGAVYNELHMPHHELPGAKHKTVLMTRSFPGGAKDNFNELTFHDEKDKEEIYFHAERDFKRVVEHDDVLEIGEKETGGQTITIEGDQTLTIKQGNREQKVETGTDTSTIKGDQTVTVQSGNHKLDISAGKSEVSAGQSIELKVGGNTLKIEAAGITLTVGGSTIKVEQAGVTIKGMTVKAEGSISAEVKGMMTTVSGDGMLQTKGGITMMQ